MDLSAIGRALVVLGVVIAAVGIALVLADRAPLIGRLPGDITLRGDRWTVYLPIATSILLSVAVMAVLSLVAWLGSRR